MKLFKQYFNLEDFLSDTTTFKRGDNKTHSEFESVDITDAVWSGAKTYDEAIGFARHGKNIEAVATALEKVEQHHLNMEAVNDVKGSVVDMDSFLTGIPENMIDFPLVENNRFAHIVFLISENAGAEGQLLENKSIAVANLVDSLEAKNFRVKVSVMDFSRQGYSDVKEYGCIIPIKEFREPLSIGQLSGVTAPSFFRRLIFRWREKYVDYLASSYGVSATPTKSQIAEMVGDQDFIFLPSSRESKFNLNILSEAIKWAEFYSQENLNTKL